MNTLYQTLDQLAINFDKYEHPAVYTVADAQQYGLNIDAGETKNLLLQNQKKSSCYLVIAESSKRIDLKSLALLLKEKKLSFASPERLLHYLDLTPGSVSPFGLINDKDKFVKVVVDKDLLKHKTLGFHPNINTATLVIKTDDFDKFLKWSGNQISYLDI